MQLKANICNYASLIIFSLLPILAPTWASADTKNAKDLPQLKAFTYADIKIPTHKIPLSTSERQDFMAKIKQQISPWQKMTLNASATSKNQIKDINHKGAKNQISLEFVKIISKKSQKFILIELNSFKIGKMPFNAYAEMQVPFTSVFKDEKGWFYIDYQIPNGLRETNFIKVMGTKSKITQFRFKFSQAENRAKFFILSQDKIPLLGDKLISIFGDGKLL